MTRRPGTGHAGVMVAVSPVLVGRAAIDIGNLAQRAVNTAASLNAGGWL